MLFKRKKNVLTYPQPTMPMYGLSLSTKHRLRHLKNTRLAAKIAVHILELRTPNAKTPNCK